MSALRKFLPFHRPAEVSLNVAGLTEDRRTPAQREALRAARQEAADLEIERRWRDNVRVNEVTKLPQKLRLLRERFEADLPDPDPEFDDWRDAAAFDAGVPRFGEIR